MVWSAKHLGKDRNYIVIRHQLKDIEGMINGVKFRNGYGVVDKNSKLYTQLKRLPYLKNALEFPLIHLSSLKFITRDSDVEVVYGKDVYYHYARKKEDYQQIKLVEQKQQEIQEHMESPTYCKYPNAKNGRCNNKLSELSPSGYCTKHILVDPKVEEVTGTRVPARLSKDEKVEWKKKILKQLSKKK